jgi:MFS transporter, PAT family, beta-lactamase induction signal transducer AmpG
MNGISASSETRRWTALVLLGFASGLPYALSGDFLAAWLTDAGFDAGKIGLLGLAALPYAFKVVWSPLADRYAPPFLGRRRGWLLIVQLLLVAAILLLARTDPKRSLAAVAVAAAIVATLSATQDIVVDAWRADVLAVQQRGPGAAISVVGYRLGMVASGAGALILVGRLHLSWPTACRLVAAAMGLGVMGTLIAVEPQAIARPRSLGEAVVHPLANFLARPGGRLILLFVFIFKLPESLAGWMSLPYLLKLGFLKSQVGTIQQGLGMLVTIGGALAGGGLVRRWGIWRSLWVFGVLHSVSNLAFLCLTRIGPNDDALVAVIVIENICVGLTTAGFIAWMIGQCDSRYSAFQFALLSGVMALGRIAARPLSGWMAYGLGWPHFFAVSALCGLPGLLLLPWVSGEMTSPAGPETPTARDSFDGTIELPGPTGRGASPADLPAA